MTALPHFRMLSKLNAHQEAAIGVASDAEPAR